jgi:hypothetical protein
LRVVSSVAFIATKYTAFLDRGEGDYYASHDLEDLLTVIDGPEKIVEEMMAADRSLRAYVAKAMATLVSSQNFLEALPGLLPDAAASQGRLPGLRLKLAGIAAAG